jgi:RNase P protein component
MDIFRNKKVGHTQTHIGISVDVRVKAAVEVNRTKRHPHARQVESTIEA